MNTAAPLPALHQGTLDAGSLEQLLSDLTALTEMLEILPKFDAEERITERHRLDLEEAAALLRERRVRAIQFRYRYQGSEWWDTVQVRPKGWSVVRIEHRWNELG